MNPKLKEPVSVRKGLFWPLKLRDYKGDLILLQKDVESEKKKKEKRRKAAQKGSTERQLQRTLMSERLKCVDLLVICSFSNSGHQKPFTDQAHCFASRKSRHAKSSLLPKDFV